MIKIFVSFLFFCSVFSHLCVIDPPQRGALKFTLPGEEECFRPYSQCGKQSPETPKVTKIAGSVGTVVFQQNYNHWFEKNPGSLDVAISYKVDNTPLNDSDFEILASISDYPAHEMVVQQNFTLTVTWPKKPCDHCVLRFRYVSNNPDEASANNPTGAFYQCVDIKIAAAEDHNIDNTIKLPKMVKENSNAPYSCCAAKQFTAKSSGSLLSKGQTFQYTVYFDSKNKMGRWDQSFYDVNLNFLYSWSLFTNYQTLREYIFNPATNSCDLTGPNAIYDWCYGNTPQMTYGGRVSCNAHEISGLSCDKWSMDNGFTFLTIPTGSSTCRPYLVKHEDSTGITNYMKFYSFEEKIVDSKVFELPPSCKRFN